MFSLARVSRPILCACGSELEPRPAQGMQVSLHLHSACQWLQLRDHWCGRPCWFAMPAMIVASLQDGACCKLTGSDQTRSNSFVKIAANKLSLNTLAEGNNLAPKQHLKHCSLFLIVLNQWFAAFIMIVMNFPNIKLSSTWILLVIHNNDCGWGWVMQNKLEERIFPQKTPLFSGAATQAAL